MARVGSTFEKWLFFIHLDLAEHDPSLKRIHAKEWRAMFEDWNHNRQHLPNVVITMATKDSPGLHKFRERLGFIHIRDMFCYDDQVTRRVYVNVKTPELMDSPYVQWLKTDQGLW